MNIQIKKIPCNPNDTVIKRLTTDHVSQILHLEKMCFSMPWNATQFTRAFKQENFAAFGLMRPSEGSLRPMLIAYVSFYHALDEVEILNIAVEPAFRRQKLASFLLSATLQRAVKMGIKRVVLEVRVSNTAAIKLYTGLRFTRVGKRPKYYSDTGEDALIYALEL